MSREPSVHRRSAWLVVAALTLVGVVPACRRRSAPPPAADTAVAVDVTPLAARPGPMDLPPPRPRPDDARPHPGNTAFGARLLETLSALPPELAEGMRPRAIAGPKGHLGRNARRRKIVCAADQSEAA